MHSLAQASPTFTLEALATEKSMGAYQPAAELGQLNLPLSAFLDWI